MPLKKKKRAHSCVILSAPRKPNNGQTQPSRPTMSLACLYRYGVGLLESETSAGTSLGAVVITSNIKWAEAIPIPIPNSDPFPSRKDPGLSPLHVDAKKK